MSLPGLCVSVCLCNICLSVFSSVCPAVCLLSSPLPVPIPYLPVSLLSSYPSCLPSFLPSLPPFNSACHLHPFLSDAHSFIASCLMFPHPSPMPPVTAIPSCLPPPPLSVSRSPSLPLLSLRLQVEFLPKFSPNAVWSRWRNAASSPAPPPPPSRCVALLRARSPCCCSGRRPPGRGCSSATA